MQRGPASSQCTKQWPDGKNPHSEPNTPNQQKKITQKKPNKKKKTKKSETSLLLVKSAAYLFCLSDL